MSSRPLLRVLFLGAVVVALGASLWVGWQIWRVNSDMRAAVSDASDLQAALESGDEEQADEALADLQEHSQSAADRTDSRTWSALTKVPGFGDDAEGVRLVADVVSDLAEDGVAPLVDEAANLEAMLPTDGRVPLDRLVALQEPVASASQAFAEADQRLSAEDPSTFVGPFKTKYRDLTRRISDAADVLSTADVALDVMPGMLGQSGPRDYLLVFQNNAEVRATGGLPGAVSLLHADAGRLTMTRQVAGSSFGMTDEPVLPLTQAEEEIYGRQLGTYFLDANFTPDFPRTAALMKARWEQVYDDQIDGVFSIDPVALSYILEATGPVQVGDIELTHENAVAELLHEPYLRYEDPADQDEFFKQAAKAIFERVTSGAGDPNVLLESLSRAGDEHRVFAHSFDAEEQDALGSRAVAGQLVMEPTPDPQVGVYLNDGTGAKMSYFLRTTVRVDSTSCTQGIQKLSASARLRSEAPNDAGSTLPDTVTGGGSYGIEPGAQLVAVRLYAPVDGVVERVTLNSKPVRDLALTTHDSRQVASVFVFLEPQQTVDLSWRMTTGNDQTEDVVVSVTPTIEPKNSSFLARSSC